MINSRKTPSKLECLKGLPIIGLLLVTLAVDVAAQTRHQKPIAGERIAPPILLRIVKAEDERRWDNDLMQTLSSRSSAVRLRSALAAGRIGNEASIPTLVAMLKKDPDNDVRAMAAFAIGEVESPAGADALVAVAKDTATSANVRSRAIEALGKIAAALPKDQETRQRELGLIVLDALRLQGRTLANADIQTVLLGLTAVLRSHPPDAGTVVAGFLRHKNSRVRADAANVLARLRLKDGNDQLRRLLKSDPDPVVRANAARVLGATEDKLALAALLDSATTDNDSRVRVSAIRALGSLKDTAVKSALIDRGTTLTQTDLSTRPSEANEVLEIAAALGRILPNKEDQFALNWLRTVRNAFGNTAPEAEVAYVRIWPSAYLSELGDHEIAVRNLQRKFIPQWRAGAAIASALGEIAGMPNSITDRGELKEWAERLLDGMLDYRKSDVKINSLLPLHTEYAIPEVLRAFAAYKSEELPEVLHEQLNESDVIVRATAAELIGNLPPSDTNTRTLAAALPRALQDELNDAALSILDSLAKQKTAAANEVIKTALDSRDHLIRRRAVALLKTNGAGDFSARIGVVLTRNTAADYQRALSRIGEVVRVAVTTSRGSFTIELLPAEAPLTVDNFIQLAQRGYFRGIPIHRVVPNFVIQDGDPRGDGNGGPGYQIRCEINQVPFDRAAVGMALSGKDTGGSQWFVTHSPQPHLDGGYTVFGRVVKGMDVVDKVVRGDVIQSVEVVSKPARR